MAMNFGKARLMKISNESKNNVLFFNPYRRKRGDIAAGTSEADACSGFIPTWDSNPRYEITYYNDTLKKEALVQIKDLGNGSWLISFAHDGKTETIAEIRPQPSQLESHFEITIKDQGFEIFDIDAKSKNLALLFW